MKLAAAEYAIQGPSQTSAGGTYLRILRTALTNGVDIATAKAQTVQHLTERGHSAAAAAEIVDNYVTAWSNR